MLTLTTDKTISNAKQLSIKSYKLGKKLGRNFYWVLPCDKLGLLT